VLWRCWLGGRKGIRPVKIWVLGLAWLSVWSEMQTCIWPSWCHCHSLSLASVKSRLVLRFWYWLTWVVPDRGLLNGCVRVCYLLLECKTITVKQMPLLWCRTPGQQRAWDWDNMYETEHEIRSRVRNATAAYPSDSYYGIKGFPRQSNGVVVGACCLLILLGCLYFYLGYRYHYC